MNSEQIIPNLLDSIIENFYRFLLIIKLSRSINVLFFNFIYVLENKFIAKAMRP